MMNLKIKTLIAAASLAIAGNAAAAINNGSAGDFTGEVFLYAYNTTTSTSFTFDTGLTFANFLPSNAISKNFDLNGDTNYTAFLGANTTPSQIKWAVGAFNQGSGAGDPLGQALTTISVGQTFTGAQTNNGLNNISAKVNTFIAAVNVTGTHNTLANGSAYQGTNTNAYAGNTTNGPKTNWNGILNSKTATGSLDQQLNFWQLAVDQNLGASGQALLTQYVGGGQNSYWTLTSGEHLIFNVAAVPEPGTWAMLLAGLMMVGGIARRRMS